ncbi:hypothetical protein BGX21_001214 [Mortierella sp. AD011]|nr:hypothetical protein BGX20_011140 [Mortierella sp. AD010]KAF9384790.1 hypothetical protein BGX21_001214 [Mortierella sp. AD011]
MLKSIATTLKGKLSRPEPETTSATEVITSPDDPTTTTIRTTTTTNSFSQEEDNAKTGETGISSESIVHTHSTLSHTESTVTTTIHEQTEGGISVDNLESTSVVSYKSDDVSTLESTEYPGTISAKYVKEQSDAHNLSGLKHALSAAIAKSSAAHEVGKLFEGGILTSANHKKWYHATLPINWVHKFSSEHHYGNYVISDRATGAKIWEDMPIYARIGMHLLFATMVDRKLLQTHQIHHLFSVESVNQGKHFDAPESVAQIEHFIKTYKIDLSELLLPEISQYHTFNEFFYRKLKPDARPIHEIDNPNVIVSGADCRLCVFESISAATEVWIKGKSFSVKNLVQDETLATEFDGGSIALFRLAPQDYHRFHTPVTGTIVGEPTKVDGTYFTVNPMAVNEDLDVFTENVRKVTVIDLEQQEETKNEHFDKCIFVSIGALLVGSIDLTGAKVPGNKVRKGDELGYFAYGGSTCILLFKAGAVKFDEDLLANSQKGIETLVRVGERIGARL